MRYFTQLNRPKIPTDPKGSEKIGKKRCGHIFLVVLSFFCVFNKKQTPKDFVVKQTRSVTIPSICKNCQVVNSIFKYFTCSSFSVFYTFLKQVVFLHFPGSFLHMDNQRFQRFFTHHGQKLLLRLSCKGSRHLSWAAMLLLPGCYQQKLQATKRFKHLWYLNYDELIKLSCIIHLCVFYFAF